MTSQCNKDTTLIGGFYRIDPELGLKEPFNKDFILRCDTQKKYNRKIYTGNGRTATSYILKNPVHLSEEDVILLPDYLCVSVINSLEVSKAKFRFYKVNRDLGIDIEDLKNKMDNKVKVLYVIHYFGRPQAESVVKEIIKIAKESNAIILEDITQALYSVDPGRIGFGDYMIASTRKWMPATDGGILAIKDNVCCPTVPLKNAYDEATYKELLISIFRDYYDTHPEADISYYLQLEKEANAARYLDFTPRNMTDISKRIMLNMNHCESMRKRRENYMYLYENLKDVKGIELLQGPLDDDGRYVPFGFVVLTDERDKVYSYLTRNHIIPEIQWILPREYYRPGEDASYLSEHNIMLQCDQRYDISDMDRVVECIKRRTICQ